MVTGSPFPECSAGTGGAQSSALPSCCHSITRAHGCRDVRCPRSVPSVPIPAGTAVRHCDEHKGWLPPNLFNCTSLAFAALKGFVSVPSLWGREAGGRSVRRRGGRGVLRFSSPQAERLVRNESVLDTAQSQRVALQLHNATRHTAAYFGSDVRLAYRLAARLLQHESAQRGFRLAATQDVHFTEVWGQVGEPPRSAGSRGWARGWREARGARVSPRPWGAGGARMMDVRSVTLRAAVADGYPAGPGCLGATECPSVPRSLGDGAQVPG